VTDEHRIDEHQCGGDVAAYALGALEPAEVEVFRRHLEGCVVCRDELIAFQRIVDVLPLSAPQYSSPPGLRDRVLRAVADEAGPAAVPASRRPERRRFRFRAPTLAFGGALALAVAAVVVVLSLSSSQSSSRVIDAQVSGDGTASLRVGKGHAELVVHRLPSPPAGKIYEVWLQRGNGAPAPTSALFSVTAKGDADVDVPGSLKGVSRVLVTPEPAGGSRVPTHVPVIRADLT
jgi:hypothetical protein